MNSNINHNYKVDGSVIGDRKKLWKAEVVILDHFIEVCKKYDVKVFLAYGTLLGAIRHKGFIPWDEDIDVAVTRDDFIKICNFAEKEFNGVYFWQTPFTDRLFFFRYGRLRRNDMLGVTKWTDGCNYNNGLFIDVFILDEVPVSMFARKKLWVKTTFYGFALSNYYHRVTKTRLASFLYPFIRFYNFFHSYDKIWKCFIYSYKKAVRKPSGIYAFLDEKKNIYKVFDKTDIFPYCNVMFEKKEYYSPNNYDAILKILYGEYMKYPPIEERYNQHKGFALFSAEISYKQFKEFFSDWKW